MDQLKGTKSEENVRKAFAGESQARSKYIYYAEQAKKEGKADIADLFERMAQNELAHARLWFKLLNNGLGDTLGNLKDAASGENSEWQSMYPDFAKQAREDGLEELAKLFEMVAGVERQHEQRFLQEYARAYSNVQQKPVEQAPAQVETKPYRCMFCGHESDTPLDVCPLCEAIGAYEVVR